MDKDVKLQDFKLQSRRLPSPFLYECRVVCVCVCVCVCVRVCVCVCVRVCVCVIMIVTK